MSKEEKEQLKNMGKLPKGKKNIIIKTCDYFSFVVGYSINDK